MKVIMRVDASLEIGAGHVARCLTLANGLRKKGAQVRFLSREHAGNLCSLIEAQGFSSQCLAARVAPAAANDPPHARWLGARWEDDADDCLRALSDAPIDWMIVDHYALDGRWEAALRKSVRRIAVIDDLADRAHDCDLLLDQSLLPDFARRYDALLSPGARRLLGPEFTLLRDEFTRVRAGRAPRDGQIRRVLVAFGGVDANNFTSAALEVFADSKWPFVVDAVVGAANPNRESLAAWCALRPRFNCHVQTSRMAELMADADLALVAGGFTSYETAFMGVPALLFPLSPIQAQVSQEIAASGAAITLGLTTRFDRDAVFAAVAALATDPARCLAMAEAGGRLFDGLGVARVAQALLDR